MISKNINHYTPINPLLFKTLGPGNILKLSNLIEFGANPINFIDPLGLCTEGVDNSGYNLELTKFETGGLNAKSVFIDGNILDYEKVYGTFKIDKNEDDSYNLSVTVLANEVSPTASDTQFIGNVKVINDDEIVDKVQLSDPGPGVYNVGTVIVGGANVELPADSSNVEVELEVISSINAPEGFSASPAKIIDLPIKDNVK